MEKGDSGKSKEEDFDPDDYIRTAVTYGRLDLVRDWLPHHRGDPHRISELVLFPAAMFGQLELLSCGLDYGKELCMLYVDSESLVYRCSDLKSRH